MTTHQLRTFMEHHLLPGLFFKFNATFLEDLATAGETLLATLYHSGAETNNDTSPFSEDDFTIISSEFGNHHIMKIILPKPEDELECYYIILCFTKNNDENDVSDLHYLTIEKSASSPILDMLREKYKQEIPIHNMMLCEWTEDRKHMNYGPVSSDKEIDCHIRKIIGE